VAGVADVGEGLLRAGWVLVENMLACAGLHADQRYVVADNVVQLAGDLEALLRDPAQPLFFAAALCLEGIGTPAADGVAQEDGCNDPGRVHGPGRAVAGYVGVEDGQAQDGACPQRHTAGLQARQS
jgi:hypothetical protein